MSKSHSREKNSMFGRKQSLEFIEKKDSLTFEDLGATEQVRIWPGSQYMQDKTDLTKILLQIEEEMNIRVSALLKE